VHAQPVEDGVPLDTVLRSMSEEELVMVLEMIVNEAVEEVVNSTCVQPSIPGVVCEVISDIVRSLTVVSEADLNRVTAAATNGNAAHCETTPARLIAHHAQVCRLISCFTAYMSKLSLQVNS